MKLFLPILILLNLIDICGFYALRFLAVVMDHCWGLPVKEHIHLLPLVHYPECFFIFSSADAHHVRFVVHTAVLGGMFVLAGPVFPSF